MSANVLNPPQQRAIAALLVSRTATEAATLAGVDPRTLRRWLVDATFRAYLTQRETELVDHAMRRLLALQERAIDALDTALVDPHGSVRVRAATAILDFGLKLRDFQSIEARLAALEAAQEAKSDKEA